MVLIMFLSNIKALPKYSKQQGDKNLLIIDLMQKIAENTPLELTQLLLLI